MGGHGALVAAFKNPDAYAAVSAFAPICNPSLVNPQLYTYLPHLALNPYLPILDPTLWVINANRNPLTVNRKP